MKEFVCIVCPRGCRLKIDDELNVTGNFCPRGAIYAKEEVTAPKRIITSSVRVSNRNNLLVSVKTSIAVPKEKMFDVMKEINKLKIDAPTHIGDVVCNNILNTGADIIITKEIK